jgi:hypothetical protein
MWGSISLKSQKCECDLMCKCDANANCQQLINANSNSHYQPCQQLHLSTPLTRASGQLTHTTYCIQEKEGFFLEKGTQWITLQHIYGVASMRKTPPTDNDTDLAALVVPSSGHERPGGVVDQRTDVYRHVLYFIFFATSPRSTK